jgi:ribosomal protein L11 methyltransferase
MPYRIDLHDIGDDALDRLVELGALDVERLERSGIAALMPDGIEPAQVARALSVDRFSVSPATGRDADSVWVLRPGPVRVGRIRVAPADSPAEPGVVRLRDAPAFGTGLHPTTALCLEALDAELQMAVPDTLLDVGTGSGVLALAALMLGVPNVCALDLDRDSLTVAKENARINGVRDRLQLSCGGPEAVTGTWPLVLANILAAPLIEMAPTLVRRVGHHGRLVLSGVPLSVEDEVQRAYGTTGMRFVKSQSRGGWVALVLQASW